MSEHDPKLLKRVLKHVTKAGDCWIWNGGFDVKEPTQVKFNVGGGELQQIKIKYPQPIMIYQGKRTQPVRHFFPGLSPKVRLQKLCPTKQCQNPEHRLPSLEHLMSNHEFDLSHDEPEDLQALFPWASLTNIKAVHKRLFS